MTRNGIPPEGIELPTIEDFQFNGMDGFIGWGLYGNGRLAVTMMSASKGGIQTLLKISVDVDEETPAVGCFFVKDWSENEGIMDALVEQGVVEDTGRRVPVGHTEAKEARLLIR